MDRPKRFHGNDLDEYKHEARASVIHGASIHSLALRACIGMGGINSMQKVGEGPGIAHCPVPDGPRLTPEAPDTAVRVVVVGHDLAWTCPSAEMDTQPACEDLQKCKAL